MIELRENEHPDENGLPICNKCETPCFVKNPYNNTVVRCACKCESEKTALAKQEFEKQQKAIKVDQMKMSCLLGKRYKNASFDIAEIDEGNSAIYAKVKEYAEHYEEMLTNGNGFYIYGAVGIGKTHLLACLCNYLTDHLQDCAFTNFLNIAEEIKASYNGEGNEQNVIAKYSRVKFLFIDDFGKESYKKLKSDASNLWLEEKIFEILNNRYNNMYPTIFSSNYSPEQMAKSFGFDRAIIDRILELSTIIFEMHGKNRRICNRKNDWWETEDKHENKD